MSTLSPRDSRAASKIAANHEGDMDDSIARSMSASLHEAKIEMNVVAAALKEAIKNPADLRTALSTLDKMWGHMVDAIEANGWSVDGTRVHD